MDGRFLDSFTLLPRQRVVCGRATRPLCLRHRIMLTAVKSPFVDGSSVPTPKDVIIFSRIVSTYDMAEMTDSKPTKSDLEWYERMTDDDKDFISEVEECLGCIGDQAKWPIFWEAKKGGKVSGAPWVLSVICNLVKNGVPLETAWTMPESQAVWMNAVFSINNGAEISIVSDEDKRAMEQLRAMDEAMKSGKADKPVHPRLKKASQN